MIQMPLGWTWNRLTHAMQSIGSAPPTDYWGKAAERKAAPSVRTITRDDVSMAVAEGWEDFKANRTDVIFLCVMYPLLGLLLSRLASGSDLLPLIFPLASGFALVGPLAAIGLNEMSRRREAGGSTSWVDAFGVIRAPSLGAIAVLGSLLVALLATWLVAAGVIYSVTMGPEQPASAAAFLHDVLTTRGGWELMVFGVGAGFLFALLALSLSVVSFPLLLDRDVDVNVAMATSIRAVRANPGPMALWAAIVAGGLLVGSLPLLLGLAIVLPVLGHATWHLYRKIVT